MCFKIFSKENIPNEEYLYRRILSEWWVTAEKRISSLAFRHYNTSVNWARHTTPEKSVRKYPECRLAEIQAKVPREKDQRVEHSPSCRNRSHSLIIGKKTLSISRFLASNSKVIIDR
jgi:hypothetical protein